MDTKYDADNLQGYGKYRYLEKETPEEKYVPLRKQGMRDQLDWIKRQLEYIDVAEKYKLRYDLKKGEIYEVDWGLNINAEFSNKHYGLVLTDSNQYNPLVIMCPLRVVGAGQVRRKDVDLGFIPELNGSYKTLAIVNQVRTVDKLRIFTKQRFGEKRLLDSQYDEADYGPIYRLDETKVNLVLLAYYNIINGVD